MEFKRRKKGKYKEMLFSVFNYPSFSILFSSLVDRVFPVMGKVLDFPYKA